MQDNNEPDEAMTEAERKMLQETHDGMKELRDALLGVPAGSPKEAKPLLEDLRVVARAYQRGSWAVRAIMWLLPTVAGLGYAIKQIKDWFFGG